MQRDSPIGHGHDVLCPYEACEVGLEAVNKFPLRRNPCALEALQDIRLLVAAKLRAVNGNSDAGKWRAHRVVILREANAESIAAHSVAPTGQGLSRCRA